MKERIETALEFLKEGSGFPVGDLRLSMKDPQTVEVNGWSNYIIFSNINKRNSLKELADIKRIFNDMVEFSDNLKKFIADKSIEYNLFYDDGGKASIRICFEKGGVMYWMADVE